MKSKSTAGPKLDAKASLAKLCDWLVRYRGHDRKMGHVEMALAHIGRHEDSGLRPCTRLKCRAVADSIFRINDYLIWQTGSAIPRAASRRAYETQVELARLLPALEALRPYAIHEHAAAVAIGPASLHRHELLCVRRDKIERATRHLVVRVRAVLTLLHGFGDELMEGMPNFHSPRAWPARDRLLTWLAIRLNGAGRRRELDRPGGRARADFTDQQIAELIIDGGNPKTAAERVRKRRTQKTPAFSD